MSSDPLARSDFWAGAPNDVEYDAVYATVTATERGRWFLTEYANRNRHADTDLVVAAIARIESVIRGDAAPRSFAPPSRELVEIAETIGRIRVVFGEPKPAALDIGAAAERISDVAFELRERASDPALCNALDDAVREISEACANKEVNGKPAHGGTELLSDLARRVDELISLSAAPWSSLDAGADAKPPQKDVAVSPAEVTEALDRPAEAIDECAIDEDALSAVDLVNMELAENKKFTEAVAALAASLTSHGDESGTPAELQSQSADDFCPSPQDGSASEPSHAASAENGPRWHIEPPDFVFRSAKPYVENTLSRTSDPFQQSHPMLPAARLQSGPDDDPAADLFEQPHATGDVTPIAALNPMPPESPAMPSSAVPVEEIASVAEVPPPQLRLTNGNTGRAAPRLAPSDRLAAIRALSEEELIALFG